MWRQHVGSQDERNLLGKFLASCFVGSRPPLGSDGSLTPFSFVLGMDSCYQGSSGTAQRPISLLAEVG